MFGLAYMIFYIIFQLGFDNPPVYDIIDWTVPGEAFLYGFVMPFVIILIAWLFSYGVYRLRVFIAQKCCKSSVSVAIDTDTENSEDMYVYTNNAVHM